MNRLLAFSLLLVGLSFRFAYDLVGETVSNHGALFVGLAVAFALSDRSYWPSPTKSLARF